MLPEQEMFFIQLYEDNFWKLKRYAGMFLPPTQAEETVQDAFHEGVEKIDILFCHEKPEAWLMGVLKNKIRNLQRRNQRELLWIVSLDLESVMAIPAAEIVDDLIEQNQMQASAIKKIENTLSDDELYILKRSVFDQSSHKELSAELGISVWASQKRLERIRDKLGKLFPGYRKNKNKNF